MTEKVSPPSTKPYLIRAIYEWCGDNGLTPYLVIEVDDHVVVPREYANSSGEVILNISSGAVSGLELGNEFVSFKARFGGVARDVLVPVGRIGAIYARENMMGMSFMVLESDGPTVVPESECDPRDGASSPFPNDGSSPVSDSPPPTPSSGRGGRPVLKRIK